MSDSAIFVHEAGAAFSALLDALSYGSSGSTDALNRASSHAANAYKHGTSQMQQSVADSLLQMICTVSAA